MTQPQPNQEMIADADALELACEIMQKYSPELKHLRALIKEMERTLRKMAELLTAGERVIVWSEARDESWPGQFMRYDDDGRADVYITDGADWDPSGGLGIDPRLVTRAGRD
jgi:hypothetical protein